MYICNYFITDEPPYINRYDSKKIKIDDLPIFILIYIYIYIYMYVCIHTHTNIYIYIYVYVYIYVYIYIYVCMCVYRVNSIFLHDYISLHVWCESVGGEPEIDTIITTYPLSMHYI